MAVGPDANDACTTFRQNWCVLVQRTRPYKGSLNLAKLNRVDDFSMRQGIGDHDQPGVFRAPIAAFEVGERIENRFLGIVVEFHQEWLDAPGKKQLSKESFVVGERVNGNPDGSQGGEGVCQESASRENDDAGFSEFLRQHGGGAEHLGLGLLQCNGFVEAAFFRWLDAAENVFQDFDALYR